jgi:hypothetical protein
MQTNGNTDQPHQKKSWLEAPVQSIILTVIGASLIGGFVKVTNISDNVLIIREQAYANRGIIDNQGSAIMRLQMNDLNKNDRIVILEQEIKVLKEKISPAKQ